MNKKNRKKDSAGFTLLELLIVIGIIAILSAVVIVAINPNRQFKLARDSQRMANVSAIANALGQNIAENHGTLVCGGTNTSIPKEQTPIKNPEGFNIVPCIIPDHMSVLPFDPSASGAHYTSADDYDTKYIIYSDSSGRIVASSTGEMKESIHAIR